MAYSAFFAIALMFHFQQMYLDIFIFFWLVVAVAIGGVLFYNSAMHADTWQEHHLSYGLICNDVTFFFQDM